MDRQVNVKEEFGRGYMEGYVDSYNTNSSRLRKLLTRAGIIKEPLEVRSYRNALLRDRLLSFASTTDSARTND